MKVTFFTLSMAMGGAERVIKNLAEKYSEQGHQVSIITCFKAKEEYIIANRLIINRKNINISNNDVAQLEIVDKNNIKYKFVDFIKSFEDDTGKELKYPIKSYTDLISNI